MPQVTVALPAAKRVAAELPVGHPLRVLMEAQPDEISVSEFDGALLRAVLRIRHVRYEG